MEYCFARIRSAGRGELGNDQPPGRRVPFVRLAPDVTTLVSDSRVAYLKTVNTCSNIYRQDVIIKSFNKFQISMANINCNIYQCNSPAASNKWLTVCSWYRNLPGPLRYSEPLTQAGMPPVEAMAANGSSISTSQVRSQMFRSQFGYRGSGSLSDDRSVSGSDPATTCQSSPKDNDQP